MEKKGWKVGVGIFRKKNRGGGFDREKKLILNEVSISLRIFLRGWWDFFSKKNETGKVRGKQIFVHY